MQREHNEKSVRPIGAILRQNFENKIGVIFENRGLGPLLIKTVSIRDTDTNQIIGRDLINVMPPLLNGRKWSNYRRGLKGSILQANKSIELLLLTGDVSDPIYIENRDLIRNALGKLIIELEFTDLYGNLFKIDEPLATFARN
ncbi:MAG: hypothetical protein DU489_07490 [Nitrosomonas sp.]|uniref:hypothetical protein n=1 Tax=Nitrosomonas sp. TaxID=42353 RepID=UPI0032EF19C7